MPEGESRKVKIIYSDNRQTTHSHSLKTNTKNTLTKNNKGKYHLKTWRMYVRRIGIMSDVLEKTFLLAIEPTYSNRSYSILGVSALIIKIVCVRNNNTLNIHNGQKIIISCNDIFCYLQIKIIPYEANARLIIWTFEVVVNS